MTIDSRFIRPEVLQLATEAMMCKRIKQLEQKVERLMLELDCLSSSVNVQVRNSYYTKVRRKLHGADCVCECCCTGTRSEMGHKLRK